MPDLIRLPPNPKSPDHVRRGTQGTRPHKYGPDRPLDTVLFVRVPADLRARLKNAAIPMREADVVRAALEAHLDHIDQRGDRR